MRWTRRGSFVEQQFRGEERFGGEFLALLGPLGGNRIFGFFGGFSCCEFFSGYLTPLSASLVIMGVVGGGNLPGELDGVSGFEGGET